MLFYYLSAVILLLVCNIQCSQGRVSNVKYEATWAAEIPGGTKIAEAIADQYGINFKGHVSCFCY